MKKIIECYPEYYFFDEFRNYYGIKTKDTTREDSQILLKLTEPFVMQDILPNRYQTAEEFLEDYTLFSINDIDRLRDMYGISQYEEVLIVNERGNVEIKPQYKKIPGRSDATLDEALEDTEKKELYDEKEKRVYTSRMYMDWHRRYCMSKSKTHDSYDYEDI